ncbi:MULTISPECIES: septum site-determining protein Ssd [unclassified Arthrobacter]|uniref:septum site-determining protein Ssd n=1 Tax=unclassified Arthrobacter TaxID=235627 RepID=UPI002E0C7173|nr:MULTISPECIES: septum site-determining protein Ssd [unclassified Arthrobacter]MEC5189837.1 secretion/DNA translocation related CpaE-like protein [Arthrobacter sp. MP_M4]MEC5201304.1 secretion/DNA translocation related CpaE-like protein [Arthrobacter sp. MP_M7]
MSRHQLPSSGAGRRAGSSPGGGVGPDDGAAGTAPGDAAWLPAEFAETLLVTGLEVLRSEVERVVAATGSRLRTVGDIRAAAPFWNSATEVLLGSDIRELPPRGRAPAVLVGLNGDGDGLWQLAAAVGAERVAVLPEGASWLAEYLSRSRRPEPGGFVLGFVGGCGGAGASTAAVWVAHAAARRGVSVLLVDGDPRGGGLELSIDAEETPGLRWPDLADARGTIDPRQLADSLPVADGFPFLSWPGHKDRQGGVDRAVVAGVLDAARRGFELVVMDLGRCREALRTFAWDCDRIIVMVPALLRAAVAAARLLEDLPAVETVLVVRSSPGAALDAELIAESVGLPLAGVFPDVRQAPGATERGRLLDTGRQRKVRLFAGMVLDFGAGAT